MRTVAALIVAAGMSAFMAAPVRAQDIEAGTTGTALPSPEISEFDIPALPLDEALRRYSRATRLSVVYESRLIQGHKSAPVQGAYTPRIALERLLADTGFIARVGSDGFVELQPRSAGAEAPTTAMAASNARAAQRYDSDVRARIIHALCANPALQAGHYRIALRFWVDADQHIGDLRVSTAGRPDLAPAVHAALAGLPVGAPPPGVAQPAVMLLTPETARLAGGCQP